MDEGLGILQLETGAVVVTSHSAIILVILLFIQEIGRITLYLNKCFSINHSKGFARPRTAKIDIYGVL